MPLPSIFRQELTGPIPDRVISFNRFTSTCWVARHRDRNQRSRSGTSDAMTIAPHDYGYLKQCLNRLSTGALFQARATGAFTGHQTTTTRRNTGREAMASGATKLLLMPRKDSKILPVTVVVFFPRAWRAALHTIMTLFVIAVKPA